MTIEAVIFDWGGTLTRWHDMDFHAESLALAQAVAATRRPGDRDGGAGQADRVDRVGGTDRAAHAERLHRAGETVWGRSRDHQRRATIADLFAEAGLDHDPGLLSAYYGFWEPSPSPEAFGAAMNAVGAHDPASCVYVGYRLFDDIWGGLRTPDSVRSTCR